MCKNYKVSLPILNKFLFLYPLQYGCISVLFWTATRSMFCFLFFLLEIPEVITERKLTPFSLGALFLRSEKTEFIVPVYYNQVTLLLDESFLFHYTVYHLAVGLHYKNPDLIRSYLVCRSMTWMIEMIVLFCLFLLHKEITGWYLLMLMLVKLYAFVVVYSYYANLAAEQEKNKSIEILEEEILLKADPLKTTQTVLNSNRR